MDITSQKNKFQRLQLNGNRELKTGKETGKSILVMLVIYVDILVASKDLQTLLIVKEEE